MPASPSVTSQNGQASEDARIALALEVLRQTEEKDAEKKRKAEERKAAKLAAGPQPNAPHKFLHSLVNYVTASSAASDGDDARFRALIMSVLPFIDTVANGDNTTQSRDFEVIGGLIDTMRPVLPVQ